VRGEPLVHGRLKNSLAVSAFCAAVILAASLAWAGPPPAACLEASSWPEADRLFRTSRYWLGADGAYSVDLGDERTLWLFGDTWIDPSGRGSRAQARMVRNTVAIQTGRDPSVASIEFSWRTGDDGRPADFWRRKDEGWYWPGHGIRLGDRLIVFRVLQRAVETGLGFEAAGWDAVVIDNPDDPPLSWRTVVVEPPAGPAKLIVSGGVMEKGPHVHALASTEPARGLPVFLVRWPAQALGRGELSSAEWWGGDRQGWTGDPAVPAAAIFEGGQTELSLHRDAHKDGFLIVQTTGFGAAELAVRQAAALAGPWSRPEVVYRPPEYARENIMIYAGKGHPHLAGADLVMTYATNSFEFADHLADPDLYYPRFVRLDRCGR